MSNSSQFLRAVLGDEGATALERLSRASRPIAAATVPRAALAWLEASEGSFLTREIPGIPGSKVQFTKSEGRYTGSVTLPDGDSGGSLMADLPTLSVHSLH